jgi:3'(2'), 5'-bisphosphate nucleotidase
MISQVVNIAREAGKIVMSHYSKKDIIEYKSDESPLTKADIESNKFIMDSLKTKFTYPILSEESPVSFDIRKNWSKFWLVDPLDGTKDFIAGNGEFTINIALISGKRPILGVVHIPVIGVDYWAEEGKGAFKNNNKIFNISKRNNLIGTDSNFHSTIETKSFFSNNNISIINKYGSSLKLCYLAEGLIDIYPRLNGTKEWDTAASDIILNESGCSIVDYPNRKRLLYNKKNIKNPYFIAFRNGIDWN